MFHGFCEMYSELGKIQKLQKTLILAIEVIVHVVDQTESIWYSFRFGIFYLPWDLVR